MARHGFWLRAAAICAAVSVVYPALAGAPGGAAFAGAVDRLEAVDVGTSPGPAALEVLAPAQQAWVVVESVGGAARRAVLLDDSRPVARFASGRAAIRVQPGDLLEVDGRAYTRPLAFRVADASAGLTSPRPGAEAVTVGDIARLARVTTAG